MQPTQNQKIIILIVLGAALLFALVFLGVLPGLKGGGGEAGKIGGEISFWGLFDRQDAYGAAIDLFRRKYPNVAINYRQFNDPDDYKQTLLDALAAGTGPDVFMVHNNDLYKDSNKISPLPSALYSSLQLRSDFPQVVEQDFAPQGVIYALPLSVDTLALIYNRDTLDAEAVLVPDTWDKFIEAAARLTKLSAAKVIEESGAAIGGSTKTIDTATDILGLLMLQSGTVMTSSDFRAASFASKEGAFSLTFYTQFADPKKTSYAWNDTMPPYLDAFAREKTAMVFDYAAAIPQIKFRNNFLNLGVAPAPQLAGVAKPVSYPSYWGYTVSRQTKRPDIVWDFVLMMTTSRESANAYVVATKRPPALRSLIDFYLNDADIGVFARQALIARSWPQVDRLEIKNILNTAIEAVNAGVSAPERALSDAQAAVTALMAKRVQ